MNVIVAEGDRALADALAAMAAAEGHAVRIAPTADALFAERRALEPELVLIAADLPGASAFELCGELRAVETKGGYTPLIVVSPQVPDETMVERAVMAGADDVVAFPSRPVETRARLAAQVRNKRRHDMLPSILDEARRLQIEATVDALTGLLNRKSLVAAVGAAIARGEPFSVLFVDLDKFKSINDTYGHGIGDEVLKATSAVLKKGTRHGDCAGRMGGEEFVVLLAGADEAPAKMVAERLRTMIEALRFPPEGYPPKVTASLGIGVFDPARPDAGVDAILERADKALYDAKHGGRNRWVVAAACERPGAPVSSATVSNAATPPGPEVPQLAAPAPHGSPAAPAASQKPTIGAGHAPPSAPSPAASPSNGGARRSVGAQGSNGVHAGSDGAAPANGASASGEKAAGVSGAVEKLEALVLEKLASGRAALPQLPAVAAEALAIVNRPDGSIPALVKLIEKDPPIATRLVALANSAIFSRGASITSVEGAVGRLGLLNTRDLLLQVVYASTMTDVPRFKKEVARSFQRSVLCGVAARALCKSLKEADGYAYMAGLIHEIGEARLYKVLSSLGTALPKDDAVIAEVVARHHERAGAELAKAWNLPDDIVLAAGNHHGPTADLPRPVQIVTMAAALVDEVLGGDASQSSEAHPAVEVPSAVADAVRAAVREAASPG